MFRALSLVSLIWEFKCFASMLCVSPKKSLGLHVPGYVFLKGGTKSTLSPKKPGADSGRNSPGCEPGPMGWGKGTKPEP